MISWLFGTGRIFDKLYNRCSIWVLWAIVIGEFIYCITRSSALAITSRWVHSVCVLFRKIKKKSLRNVNIFPIHDYAMRILFFNHVRYSMLGSKWKIRFQISVSTPICCARHNPTKSKHSWDLNIMTYVRQFLIQQSRMSRQQILIAVIFKYTQARQYIYI